MPPRIYNGITPAAFSAIQARAQSESGLTLNGNAGQASGHGVTVRWTYDGATLTLSLVSKPFFVPQSVIVKAFNELVNGSGT